MSTNRKRAQQQSPLQPLCDVCFELAYKCDVWRGNGPEDRSNPRVNSFALMQSIDRVSMADKCMSTAQHLHRLAIFVSACLLVDELCERRGPWQWGIASKDCQDQSVAIFGQQAATAEHRIIGMWR